MELGRAAEVDTASPPLPPFFPPVPVEAGEGEGETTSLTLLVVTGRSATGVVFGSFPPFPPFPVGDGTAGEVGGVPGDETVELRTLEDETAGRVALGSTAEVDKVLFDAGGMSVEAGGIAEDELELLAPAPPAVTVNWGDSVSASSQLSCDKMILT